MPIAHRGGEFSREDISRLERLFYAQTAEEGEHKSVSTSSVQQSASEPYSLPNEGQMEDLPLWRVQWATLPGLQEVIHVHVPHYTHMFERLMTEQKSPWRFGHLYLPGGSASLGQPQYALQPGSQAPLVGVLMEVLSCMRYPDGRLMILACGVARFKVIRVRQEVPYSRADVQIWADEEETEVWRELALNAVDDIGGDLPLAAIMKAHVEAATAAAVAAGKVWQEYELLPLRAQISQATSAEDAARQAGATKAMFRAVLANYLQKLNVDVKGPPVGHDEVVALPHSSSDDGDGVAEMEGAGLELTNAIAAEAAQRAATVVAHSMLCQDGPLPTLDLTSITDSPRINSTQQRGVLAQGPDSEGIARELPTSLSAASPGSASTDLEQLETLMWNTLDHVYHLMQRAGMPPQPLSPGSIHLSRGYRGDSSGLAPAADLASMAGSDEQWEALTARIQAELTSADDTGAATAADGEARMTQQSTNKNHTPEQASAPQRPAPMDPHSPLLFDLQQPEALAYDPETATKLDNAIDSVLEDLLGGAGASTRDDGCDGHEVDTVAGSCGQAAYPAWRRAQRLSYAMAVVTKEISVTEGRQALLEAGSITARLELVLTALRSTRSFLLAAAAVQELGQERSAETPDEDKPAPGI
ncbi:hypothetical protein WJX72_012088 [[Myrmecia] bisecta]|uniref:Lon N-terminal domain-containing protein n=1 Tax=[Myrmecia] bisecta TaxID=41462 RepID=A0AAW1Q417_9CHLO